MIEIERKFRLDAEQSVLLGKTLQEKYGPLKPIRQVDEVFLHGMDSFAHFKQGMPVARLRTVNAQTSFAYKRCVDTAGDTVEHELDVSSASTMRAILRELGYLPVTVVDKIRLEAKAGKMAIMRDQVKDLGDFCEIEVIADDESAIPYAEKRIMEEAASFGLVEADLEPRKYDQLIATAGRE